ERLDSPAARELRSPAPHARRRRTHGEGARSLMRSSVVLLGPQATTPDIGRVLTELGIRGRVALVNAGHQDMESSDEALIASLGVPAVNLKLHARANEVFEGDPELRTAYQARQRRLRDIQSFYRVRLEKNDEAARMIS